MVHQDTNRPTLLNQPITMMYVDIDAFLSNNHDESLTKSK